MTDELKAVIERAESQIESADWRGDAYVYDSTLLVADLRTLIAAAREADAWRNPEWWFHYPIEMPVKADGRGPATVGVDAVKIVYEVWDKLLHSHASFDLLHEAITEAMRLNAARAAPEITKGA